MTNEELCEELRNQWSGMAMMLLQAIRELAEQHKDEQGKVLWDVVEAEITRRIQIGSDQPMIIMTAYPPGEGPKPR